MFVRLEDGFISTSKRSDDSTTMYRLNLADCVVAYDTRSGRIDVATPVLDLRLRTDLDRALDDWLFQLHRQRCYALHRRANQGSVHAQ